MTALAYIGAALAEIAGCFAFWAWLKMGKSIWWLVPGMMSLALFGWLLTLVDTDQAGRAYAAYGGVYITAAIVWLWIIEGVRPDRWDVCGAIVSLAGAAIILLGPRSA
ncbi:YnfA family protein [Sphingobium aromaticiconvertens]|uniref:YnfA family protein n=1 Tax=Sphingobium aromaticiconvertens TaxID=365341 RepID=UPI00301A35A3